MKGDKAEVPAELTSKELDKELLWESSHWITYPFKDFDYTDIVRACATDLDYPSKDANIPRHLSWSISARKLLKLCGTNLQLNNAKRS